MIIMMMSMMMATPTAKKHNIDNHHEDHKDRDDKGKHHNDKPTMTKMYQCYYPKTLRDSILFGMHISYEGMRGRHGQGSETDP